jgi:hypothetical protein
MVAWLQHDPCSALKSTVWKDASYPFLSMGDAGQRWHVCMTQQVQKLLGKWEAAT